MHSMDLNESIGEVFGPNSLEEFSITGKSQCEISYFF